MFDFFNDVIGFFETVFEIIGSMFNAIGYLLTFCVEVASWPVLWAPWLPSIFYISMAIVFAIAVGKFILGR